MNERNNGKGIFYGVIGVATLVVAIIGATFAYFTASASVNNVIKGNMATVKLSLAVEKVVKVDETKGGMIPMSNGMVEGAVNDANNDVCVDDNGNAVCQIYKITLTNSSTAGQFVDGYVSLRYGSGVPTDYVADSADVTADVSGNTKLGDNKYVKGALFDNATKAAAETGYGTTMRWAQVFPGDGKQLAGDGVTDPSTTNGAAIGDYSTAGVQQLGTTSEVMPLGYIGYVANAESQDPHSVKDLRDENALMTYVDDDQKTITNASGVLKPLSIAGTSYNVIGTNYIRVSNHDWTLPEGSTSQTYDRAADITSALVFNHSVAAGKKAEYYIVVWLSETGNNQTAGATEGTITNPAALNFFDGNVTFISAQGSEVSATFSGYSRVNSQA